VEFERPRKRSHNVKQHKLFKEISQEVIYKIYECFDDLWNVTGFVPNPIPIIVEQFKESRITATHAVIILLAWRESRMKDYIYGLRISQ
jgi:hypothetical protein